MCLGVLITLNVNRMSRDGGVQLSQVKRADEKLYYTDRGMTSDEISAVRKSKVSMLKVNPHIFRAKWPKFGVHTCRRDSPAK